MGIQIEKILSLKLIERRIFYIFYFLDLVVQIGGGATTDMYNRLSAYSILQVQTSRKEAVEGEGGLKGYHQGVTNTAEQRFC